MVVTYLGEMEGETPSAPAPLPPWIHPWLIKCFKLKEVINRLIILTAANLKVGDTITLISHGCRFQEDDLQIYKETIDHNNYCASI